MGVSPLDMSLPHSQEGKGDWKMSMKGKKSCVPGGGLMKAPLGPAFPHGPSTRAWELGEAHGRGGAQESKVALETSP